MENKDTNINEYVFKEDNKNNYLFLKDLEKDINVFVENKASLDINLLLDENINKSVNINIFLKESAKVNFFSADFSKKMIFLNINVALLKNSSFYLISSTLANNVTKKYNIKVEHNDKFSFSNINCYGVSSKNGFIEFNCNSWIKKDCIKSSAKQQTKIILFDETSRGKGDPILKIDCDDIVANHGCAIGSLNEEHLFYLESRGIPLKEARRLITYGYLFPAIKNFKESEEQVEKQLQESLEV